MGAAVVGAAVDAAAVVGGDVVSVEGAAVVGVVTELSTDATVVDEEAGAFTWVVWRAGIVTVTVVTVSSSTLADSSSSSAICRAPGSRSSPS